MPSRLRSGVLGAVMPALGTALAALAFSPAALGAIPLKLTASDAMEGDLFGWSVAIDGDTAVVGAPSDDDAGTGSGSAYIFRWSGADWTEEAKLTASDAAAGDNFGRYVAISGETVVVGAMLDDDAGNNSGSAYVFVRSGLGWTQQAKLTAADAAAEDRFGASVAVNGDTAVISAHLSDGAAGLDQGAAYIFHRNGSTWIQEAKLTAADAATNDNFGESVDLDGDTAVIGAQLDDDSGSSSGSAYVFVRVGASWTQQAKLTAADGATDDRFGRAVAIDRDTIVVGANFDDDGGSNAGSAYIFDRTGSSWTQQAKLIASDIASDDQFGISVAISADTVLIGAIGYDDVSGANRGAAWSFVRSGSSWTQQARLSDIDGGLDDRAGHAVAVDGDIAIVGAYLDDEAAGPSQGSAIVFERVGSRWISDQRIIAAESIPLEGFGYAVDLDGDTAVIGAPRDNSDTGSAYVFTRQGSNWVQEARLVASDGIPGDLFGTAVGVSGDTVIIGSFLHDGVAGIDQGAAYVFVRSGSVWTQQQKLSGSFASAGDRFGVSVAIDGETVVVGADQYDHSAGLDQGQAYVYTRNGTFWSQQAVLRASDAGNDDRFGISVALEDDTAVIGAYLSDDTAGVDQGSAYVFVRNGSSWNQQARLIASDASGGDSFGWSVALSGDTAAVGAYRDDTLLSDQGSAYIFTRAGTAWSEQAKLTASDAPSFARFGSAVAIDGETLIVGRPRSGTGAAYLFVRFGTGWTEHIRFTPVGTSGTVDFAQSVAIDGDTAFIGAWNDGSQLSGSAYVVYAGDERLPALVRNTSSGALHSSLADAINGADGSQSLLATAPAFRAPSPVDYLGKLLSINGTGRVSQPFLNTISLADGASLNAAIGRSMTLWGDLFLPQSISATLRAASLRLGAGGAIDVGPGALLRVESPQARIDGALTTLPGASLLMTGPTEVGGSLAMFGGSLSGPSLQVDHGGRFVGDGTLATSVVNRDEFITVDNTLITGDLTNHAGAKVTVQIGTLTLLGSLTNNGTIVGDLQTLLRGQQTQPGDGFSVGGSYTAGPEASLLMPSDLWRITVVADFDVAIDSNARYDMAQAELRIGASSPSTIERMSTDIGPSPDGLDRTLPGHYPIGTLRITGSAATLVDTHDNDNLGQATCEAVYVRNLIIDAGATLNTNGCPVYYETLINNGSVDDPSNLVRIARCEADFNGDGLVNGADLGVLLGSWGLPGTDLNGDGTTNGADLGLLLGAWGVCP